ncbi:hypothetical protein DL764_000001 [Monosporascus ibericus]|uniref:Uncharacterized protein n=1 Tax=Monosporascus ibericus TaxID=155417 RepID=A0A4Q4TX59_9PEZI|nr:hypothetical protein DL764_000001 [Monosporascus ibericus]
MARTAPGPAASTLNTGFESEATLPAVVREIVSRKLRDEKLRPLEQARDEALLSIDPRHPSPWSFVCELGANYAEACHGVLRRVGHELHATLDDVLDELCREFVPGGGGCGGAYHSAATAQNPDTASVLLTPASAPARGDDEGAARALRSFESILSGSPRAPAVAAPSAYPSPSLPANCEPDQRDADPNPSVIDRAASLTEGRSPILMPLPTFQGVTNSNKKRPPPPPCPDEAAPVTADESQGPKRKKKKTIITGAAFRRTIRIGDVKDDECVFRYGDRKGLYVLRCDRALCKKRERPSGSGLGSATEGNSEEDGPIYFREYPFASYASWSHFRVLRHRTTNADQVFGRYAYRVIGATEERNLRKPESGPDDELRIKRPYWQRRARQALSPTSVAGEEGRDKKPERAIGVDDEVAASIAAACSHDELKAAFRGLRSAATPRAPAGAGDEGGRPGEQEDVNEADVTMTGAGGFSGARGRGGDGNGDDAGDDNDNDGDNNRDNDDDDDSDSVGSLPTVEHIVRSAWKKRWVDYQEKPPFFDESE